VFQTCRSRTTTPNMPIMRQADQPRCRPIAQQMPVLQNLDRGNRRRYASRNRSYSTHPGTHDRSETPRCAQSAIGAEADRHAEPGGLTTLFAQRASPAIYESTRFSVETGRELREEEQSCQKERSIAVTASSNAAPAPGHHLETIP